MYTLINKKNTQDLNSYLLNLDLINKYSLKNVKKIPSLNKITFEFPLNEMLTLLDNSNKSESDAEIQIKTFFVLYILNCYLPFINFINIELVNKNIVQKCYIKKTILNRQLLNETLIDLFNEQNLIESFSNQKNGIQNFIFNNKKKSVTFRTFMECNNLLELEKYLNNINLSKKIKIFINFEFCVKDIFLKSFSSINLIKNLLFRFH